MSSTFSQLQRAKTQAKYMVGAHLYTLRGRIRLPVDDLKGRKMVRRLGWFPTKYFTSPPRDIMLCQWKADAPVLHLKLKACLHLSMFWSLQIFLILMKRYTVGCIGNNNIKSCDVFIINNSSFEFWYLLCSTCSNIFFCFFFSQVRKQRLTSPLTETVSLNSQTRTRPTFKQVSNSKTASYGASMLRKGCVNCVTWYSAENFRCARWIIVLL